jgi:CHASE2 domain-containing sensor protein
MYKRLLQPHSIILTIVILFLIWFINLVRLNLHYLDPFNNGIKDYEITDIVYAYLGQDLKYVEDRIVIINSGPPEREKIARLVAKLDSAGAKAIGLDFFFSDFTASAKDTLLQKALKLNDNIVLACQLFDKNIADNQLDSITGVDSFFSNYATLGYANFPSNSTKTIRTFSPQENIAGKPQPAFATAILEKYDPKAYQAFMARNKKLERIHYIGHKDHFISNHIDRILDSMSLEELTLSIKDKIILVGYAPEDDWANPLVDRHYSPLNKNYDIKAIPDIFGIVIHANVLSMILNDRYINETPRWLSFLLSVLLCYFNVILIHWVYVKFHEAFHGITRALQLVEFLLLFFIVAYVFYAYRLSIDFSLGILSVLLAYDVIMIYESLIKKNIPILQKLPEYISFLKTKPPPEQAAEETKETVAAPEHLSTEIVVEDQTAPTQKPLPIKEEE